MKKRKRGPLTASQRARIRKVEAYWKKLRGWGCNVDGQMRLDGGPDEVGPTKAYLAACESLDKEEKNAKPKPSSGSDIGQLRFDEK